MTEWKTYKLGNICDYVTSRTTNIENYISTENMLPNKGGVCAPSNVPSGTAIEYKVGDILISNIRPYFQKIWQADCNGACSADVLCIRANNKADSKYLYYLLSQQLFFDYVMSGAKGCKMPRGDKKQIMQWQISLPGLEEQRRIAGILGAIDDKIENNRRINTNLELQAQALYKQWFVDFEFPNEEGKPHKSSGGKMVDSELGLIPEGWSVKRLDDYTVIKRGGSPRPIQNYLSNTGLNWLKISDATSTNSPFILEIKEFIKEEGLSKTVFLKKGNLVLSNSATPCIPKFLGLDTCIHDGWLYFPNAKLSKEYLYLLFKNNRQEILSQGNGSVFLNLKTDILKSHLICLPNCIEKMNCFNMIVKAIFKNIENCSFKIKRLATLRDTLLPKLMNGEIKL